MPCDASNWAADKAKLGASITQMKSDLDSTSEMGEMPRGRRLTPFSDFS